MGSGREDFAEFVAADAARLLGFAYLLTGDRAAAEDVLQDALERTYRVWPRVDEPFAYVRTAITRHAINRWRRRGRRKEVCLEGWDTAARADHIQATVERLAIQDALATLAPRQRAVVVLRFLDDLSEAETARCLGCSVGTVKSQTSRALARLRRHLGAPGNDLPSPPNTRAARAGDLPRPPSRVGDPRTTPAVVTGGSDAL